MSLKDKLSKVASILKSEKSFVFNKTIDASTTTATFSSSPTFTVPTSGTYQVTVSGAGGGGGSGSTGSGSLTLPAGSSISTGAVITTSGGAGSYGYTTYSPSWSYTVETDLDRLLRVIGIEINHNRDTKTCMSCKEEKVTAFSYRGVGIERCICKDCCVPFLDKMFNINIDPKTEQLLYGKK